jgi:hypothetical protein
MQNRVLLRSSALRAPSATPRPLQNAAETPRYSLTSIDLHLHNKVYSDASDSWTRPSRIAGTRIIARSKGAS